MTYAPPDRLAKHFVFRDNAVPQRHLLCVEKSKFSMYRNVSFVTAVLALSHSGHGSGRELPLYI